MGEHKFSGATGLQPERHWNPFLAGVGIGLALLTAFVVMGRGLGASGAFSSFLAWALSLVAPDYVAGNAVHSGYLNDGLPLKSFLVFMTIGTLTGAAVSGALANRTALLVEKGPHATTASRLALAFAGAAVMAVGAKLASGCTSGQALTGGALLNVGSWTFMLMVFAGGYAVAGLLKRQWL